MYDKINDNQKGTRCETGDITLIYQIPDHNEGMGHLLKDENTLSMVLFT